MALTPRQEQFCAEYLVDLNGSAAYQRAGYRAKGNAAESAAARLLRNVQVQARIGELRKAQSARTQINADFVLNGLVENFERAMQHRPVLDRDGKETGEYAYHGAVANRALELLGRHLGMFEEQHHHEHELTGELTQKMEGTVEHHASADLAPYLGIVRGFLLGAVPPDGPPQPLDPAARSGQAQGPP